MTKQEKYDNLYLDIAHRFAQMSFAERLKVGAVIVKDDNIISFGWNGTPKGFKNSCESETGKTLPQVIHAEANALVKLAKSTESAQGATLYITHSPCMECVKLIIQSGIKRIVVSEVYRDHYPLSFLSSTGIRIKVVNHNQEH